MPKLCVLRMVNASEFCVPLSFVVCDALALRGVRLALLACSMLSMLHTYALCAVLLVCWPTTVQLYETNVWYVCADLRNGREVR